MNTSKNLMKQQWQEQEALKRFQLISPLLREDMDDAKRLQLRRRITSPSALFIVTRKHMQKASSLDSNRQTDKNTDPRDFRTISIFFWNRQSSSGKRSRNGLLHRSSSFWKQKAL